MKLLVTACILFVICLGIRAQEQIKDMDSYLEQIFTDVNQQAMLDILSDKKMLTSINQYQLSDIVTYLHLSRGDDQLKSYNKQAQIVDSIIDDAQDNLDFGTALKFLHNPTATNQLSAYWLAKLTFQINRLLIHNNPKNPALFEDVIIANSQDSIFQISYNAIFLANVIEEGEAIDGTSYWDTLIKTYPQQKAKFMLQKAHYYQLIDEYLKAEKLYEQVLSTDNTNPYVHMELGYYSIQYAQQIYGDSDTTNKAVEVMPYIEKGIQHMRKAYDLFSQQQRLQSRVSFILNEYIEWLLDNQLITSQQADNWAITQSDAYSNPSPTNP